MLKILEGYEGTLAIHVSHTVLMQSPRRLGGAQQTFPEQVTRQTAVGLCPEPAEIMGTILIFFQRIRTNVGTRGQTGAWILAIFSPVFPSCSFCFKIPLI